MALLLAQRDGLRCVAFKGDALDIHFTYKIWNVQQYETACHGRCDVHLYVLPLCGEVYAKVSATAPVSQTTVQFASLRALHGHGHLVFLSDGKQDVGHRNELHLP